MLRCLSHIQLFVTPWTIAHQAPLFMGFSRQEYWSRLPFPPPGDLPNPDFKPVSSTLAGGFFTYFLLLNAGKPCFLPEKSHQESPTYTINKYLLLNYNLIENFLALEHEVWLYTVLRLRLSLHYFRECSDPTVFFLNLLISSGRQRKYVRTLLQC